MKCVFNNFPLSVNIVNQPAFTSCPELFDILTVQVCVLSDLIVETAF